MNKNILLVLFLIFISVSFVKAQDFAEIASNVITSTANACESYGGFLKYLIGTECAATLSFVIYLVLWIVIISILFDILATYSPFSRGTSFVISLGLSVIIANFGFVGMIVEWFSEFITGGGALKLIAFLIAVLIIYVIIKNITEAEKKRRRKEKVKESEEKVIKIGKKLGEAIEKNKKENL